MRLGVACRYGEEVTALAREHGKVRVSIGEDSSLFDAVVVCAGTASRAMAASLGDHVNVYPVKGYSITVQLDDAASRAAAPKVSLLDDATKLVSSRLGEDRLRVAGTAEFNGVNHDIRADRIRPLLQWVEECFPGVNTRKVVPWAGLRPMLPDMLPKVGPGKAPGVYYNTGHGHLGWTLAAATAEMVAEVLVASSSAANR
ncbi:D-amino acid dehydrogenase small subunit [compost metagenome]